MSGGGPHEPASRSSLPSGGGADQTPPGPSAQLDPENTAPVVKRSLGHAIKVHRKAIVLLLMFVVFGLAAYLCLPKDTPVAPSATGLRIIEIRAPFTPYIVGAQLTDDHRQDKISLGVVIGSLTPQTAHASVLVTVPATTWGARGRCSPQPSTCHVIGSEMVATFELTNWSRVNRMGYREEVVVDLPGVGYNTVSNNEYISATLPGLRALLSIWG